MDNQENQKENKEESKKDNKESSKKKLTNIVAYSMLTLSTALFTFAGSYVVGYTRGYDAAYKRGILKGQDEGLALGRQQVTIKINDLNLKSREPNLVYTPDLAKEEDRKKLFVYQLEKKAVLNACVILTQKYENEPNMERELLQYNFLAQKCMAEINLIEDFFKKN